jgi:hypothetical protein
MADWTRHELGVRGISLRELHADAAAHGELLASRAAKVFAGWLSELTFAQPARAGLETSDFEGFYHPQPAMPRSEAKVSRV